MQNQRPHHHGIARAREAEFLGPRSPPFLDRALIEAPAEVRTGNHPERAIILTAIIQMHAQRDHFF